MRTRRAVGRERSATVNVAAYVQQMPHRHDGQVFDERCLVGGKGNKALNALFQQKAQYCSARELSNSLESGTFRVLHRSEAPFCGAFRRLGRSAGPSMKIPRSGGQAPEQMGMVFECAGQHVNNQRLSALRSASSPRPSALRFDTLSLTGLGSGSRASVTAEGPTAVTMMGSEGCRWPARKETIP